jgi:O-antigen biosynthesis protein
MLLAREAREGMAGMAAPFTPIALLEVELADALPALNPGIAGRHYRRARSLVRLHGEPLGLVGFDFAEHGLSAAEYGSRIWRTLNVEINHHLRQDGLPEVASLAADGQLLGLSAAGRPECARKRDQLLANAPLVSVVVPTRNRPERVLNCVASLLAQSYPRFEIIVVDNAPSTDATADLLRHRYGHSPRVRYLREDRPGGTWSRRRGLIAAKGEIVAYADDDVLADPHWLAGLLRGFAAAPEVGCVTGQLLPAELETPAQVWVDEYGFNKGFTRRIFDLTENRQKWPLYPYSTATGSFGSGANMAFKTRALREIGGFDPALGPGSPALGGEELAAFFQIVMRGYKLVYEPTAIVRHFHYREYAGLRKQVYGYGVGLTAYLTSCLFDDPKRLVELVSKVPQGLAYALGPGSPKNRRKPDGFPRQLSRLELRGMVYGPVAYVRSRKLARKLMRQDGSAEMGTTTAVSWSL